MESSRVVRTIVFIILFRLSKKSLYPPTPHHWGVQYCYCFDVFPLRAAADVYRSASLPHDRSPLCSLFVPHDRFLHRVFSLSLNRSSSRSLTLAHTHSLTLSRSLSLSLIVYTPTDEPRATRPRWRPASSVTRQFTRRCRTDTATVPPIPGLSISFRSFADFPASCRHTTAIVVITTETHVESTGFRWATDYSTYLYYYNL